MKNFIIFILLSSAISSINLYSQWIADTNGIGNLPIGSFTSNGNNIYAGSSMHGVYISTNNGSNWIQSSLGNINVFSLASNSSLIFAGASSGVYFSSNNGISWYQTSLTTGNIYGMAANGNYIFATNLTLYQSTNSGTNWSPSSLNYHYVQSLAVYGTNVYAGAFHYTGNSEGGVYLSTNNGTNWSQTNLNNHSVLSLAVNGLYAFAGTDTAGVYLTTNSGTNWTHSLDNGLWINALALSGSNVFAGSTLYGIYVSSNNGTNWIQRNEGLPNFPSVSAICITNNYIFIASSSGSTSYCVYRRPLSELVGIKPVSEQIPSHFRLFQNYPNPFNPVTKIKFEIPSVGNAYMRSVQIKIYDLLGKEITTLVNEDLNPGTYEVSWDGSNYPSGVYFYKLTAGDANTKFGARFSETKKLVLMK